VKKCVTWEVEGARQRVNVPRITWEEIVDKDTDDGDIKPSDAMDHSKWRKITIGNWSDRRSDSGTES